MAGGTVRARIGGDLFDVTRLAATRRAPALPDPAARDPREDPLAEHRLDPDSAILALPAEAHGDGGPGQSDLFASRPGDSRGSGRGTARPSAGSGPVHGRSGVRPGQSTASRAGTTGPATDRQLGFAGDISKSLRIPMPEGRDVETISGFIALHRHQLKGNRGKP